MPGQLELVMPAIILLILTYLVVFQTTGNHIKTLGQIFIAAIA